MLSSNPEVIEISDETLAARVQHGDENALAELMRRYEPKLMRYGNRFMSGGDDLLKQAVQDVFIATYQNIEGFDTNKKFSSWIYRIAHNQFVDMLRLKSKQPAYGFDFDTLFSHAVQEDVYAKEKENQEVRVLLEKGLSTLTPSYREIITLYYFEELSYKDIADVLRIPVSTVGVRLARARTALKEKLPDASLLLP
jgi:RNA polymerase sigma-70 factor (ECF subfamily)